MSDITELSRELYDTPSAVKYKYKAPEGLSEELIRFISETNNEPEWMLDLRLQAYEEFKKCTIPTWGPDISDLDLDKITYFLHPDAPENQKSWDDVPDEVKETFEKLGIPEAERAALAGAGAQMESKMAYHNLKEEWEQKGVIFLDMNEALQQHPELVKEYFSKCVPINDHMFAALHYAVWSGGTFLYVPKGVHVDKPLQAYFRMNSMRAGQFEHTLIVVEEDAYASYYEGCSAPKYDDKSLHAGCVEVFVKPRARARYSSVENWSINTYNLNTKRAIAEQDSTMEWIGGNLGCLTENAKVATNPKGGVQINKLAPGSKVISWDKETNKLTKGYVKNLVHNGKKEVFRVRAGGREIEATANHPFLTLEHKKNDVSHKKGFFHQTWTPLSRLKTGDVIAIAKQLPDFGKPHLLPAYDYNKVVNTNNQYKTNLKMNIKHLFKQVKWPKETTEDFMWFLGMVLGDGNIWFDEKNGGAKINIAIPETSDLREPLKKIVSDTFGYHITYEKDRYIIINSVPIAELLEHLGFAKKAHQKTVPDWVHTIPHSQKMAFIAGYFDADGHTGQGGIYFTSTSKDLLEGISDVAMSCGLGTSQIFNHGKARQTEIQGVSCNAKDSYRLLLNGKKIKNVPTKSPTYKEKIANIKTRRNFSGSKTVGNFSSKTNDDIGYARIDEIVSLGLKQTYDIEVEKYHNFVANGLIVHNSGVTMLYPCTMLVGKGSRADHLAIAFASKGQNQDTGAKVYHLAPQTTSRVVSKSIAIQGGITAYRGLLRIAKGAKGAKSNVECDALMIDNESQSNTYPYIDINEQDVDVGHEATVGRISDEQVFYLMSRGIPEEEAMKMLVTGFMEPITKELPIEYAVEMNKLIELEMEGSIG